MKTKPCSKCSGPGGKYRKILRDYTCDQCEERAFWAVVADAMLSKGKSDTK